MMISFAPLAEGSPEARQRPNNQGAPWALNLSVGPLSFLSGGYSAGLEWKANHHISFSFFAAGSSFTTDGVDWQGSEYGPRFDYYFHGTFQSGWYLASYAYYLDLSAKETILGREYSVNQAGPIFGILPGYAWFFKNGVNIKWGIGGRYSVMDTEATYTTASGVQRSIDFSKMAGFGPVLEVSLGYAF